MRLSVAFENDRLINKNSLLSLFEEFSTVNDVKIFRNASTSLAFIDLQNEDGAIIAMAQLQGKILEGRQLKISVSNELVNRRNRSLAAEDGPIDETTDEAGQHALIES